MKDMIEERVQDLERLVLRQVERINELEDALEAMRHFAGWRLLTKIKEEAA